LRLKVMQQNIQAFILRSRPTHFSRSYIANLLKAKKKALQSLNNPPLLF
jgi:hypothetical protein